MKTGNGLTSLRRAEGDGVAEIAFLGAVQYNDARCYVREWPEV